MDKIEIEAAGELPGEVLEAGKAGKTNPPRLEKQVIRTLSGKELGDVAGANCYHTSFTGGTTH